MRKGLVVCVTVFGGVFLIAVGTVLAEEVGNAGSRVAQPSVVAVEGVISGVERQVLDETVTKVDTNTQESIADIRFDSVPTGTKVMSVDDAIVLDGDVAINGVAEASYFQTGAGEVLVNPGETGTTALSFGKRSVYVVKASWTGGGMEGTRAWFVLTQNDMNQYTGQPTIVEIGMSQGGYHFSDTLTLEQDSALGWYQLKLSCERTSGSDARNCAWSVTRLSYH